MNVIGGLRIAAAGALVTAAAWAADATSRVLFGPADAFRTAELIGDGVQATPRGENLHLAAPAREADGVRRSVRFPLRADEGDLARFRHIEAEIANTGTTPVTFTFWALSGHGWGGVSTFSTTQSASGRETLAPGARGVFRIDLHAKYSGPGALTKAIDPAAVQRLELVFENDRGPAPATVELGAIRATGTGPAEPHDTSKRIRVPAPTREPPAAGRRVYEQLPGWAGTDVAHVLTLPREWTPGRRWPVIVEYTGNVFYHKFCHSTGRTEQGNLGYGLARGETFIVLNLPFIATDGRREQVDGWGDIDRAVDYCLAALDHAERHYGADRRAVFFTGFSRGSYAANYLALRNDRIAAVWAGFLTLRNPGAPWPAGKERGWRGVDVGWDERAARLRDRPWFHRPDELGSEVHVDGEFLEDRPSTVATRRWLLERAAQARPGAR